METRQKNESICLSERSYNHCTLSEPYAEYGGVCSELLLDLQMCFSGMAHPLNIPSHINLSVAEAQAMRLIEGLSLLMPTYECRVALSQFFCLSSFPLCDAENQEHTILREDCIELRDGVCMTYWEIGIMALGPAVLPVCEDLPSVDDEIYTGTLFLGLEGHT